MLVADFTWTEFAQQLAAGIRSGAIYAGLALAIVIIYRSTRVINFAQGEMATFSTFVCWSLMNHGLSFWAAFPIVLAIAFLGGVTIERTLIKPVENASVLTIVIVTLGLALVLNGLMSLIWGGATRPFDGPFSTRTVDVAGVPISVQDVGIVLVSFVLVGLLALFFRYTKVGLGLRAAALNPASSRLVGVRVGWMLALGWGLAAVLGAIAGLMAAPTAFLDPNMMLVIIVYAFAAAVLGGIDSPIGAVVGGLILGVTVNLLGRYVDLVGEELKLPTALAVLLLVLVIRPQGLFGRVIVRRV
jgi:branched-chain amino acid transport system permease protein